MSDMERKATEASFLATEKATNHLDDALEILVPRMTQEQIRALFEERLHVAHQDYRDFLSRPDS